MTWSIEYENQVFIDDDKTKYDHETFLDDYMIKSNHEMFFHDDEILLIV